MFKISFIFLLLWAPQALAKSFVMGHNLAITTETPEKGTFTIGNYLLAYSPADRCLIASSPWMALDYNSYSLVARCKLLGKSAFFEESSLQLAYVKSDKQLGDRYRQSVGMLWWVVKHQLNELYTLYTTLNYMYFWDETYPFSLRREPQNNQPYQFTISTLHQIKWTESSGFNFELGILGLNYHIPRFHSGYSFFKKWDSFLLQVGLSMTATPNNLDRLFKNSRPDSADNIYGDAPEYDFSAHPEIQLQYFF